MQSTFKYLIDSELKYQKNGRQKFFQTRFDYASNLFCKDLKAHFSCVNAIEWSNSGEYLASAGDDKRVLIWNVEQDLFSQNARKNTIMNAQHHSNVFALAWDNEGHRVFSGSNDHQLIVHDVETKDICDIFLHENAVLSIAVHPQQSQIFATACESGQISLYDLRLSNSDPIILASSARNVFRDYEGTYISSDDSSSGSSVSSSDSVLSTGGAFQSCHFNPVNGNLLAAANEISGLSLIDIRMNNTIHRYKSHPNYSSTNQNVMSVSFNKYGTQLAVLRNKLRPVVYETNNTCPMYTLDAQGFSNSCTLKSCCFAGDKDQYFVTGSDNFSVYCWKIPNGTMSFNTQPGINGSTYQSTLVNEVHLKLDGHRSIVNQCRYNPRLHLLASSGVEKIIKVWSPYELPGSSGFGGLMGKKNEYPPKREAYTFNELFRQSTSNSIDESDDMAVISYFPVIRDRAESLIDESLEEDRIMMAFFDSQIRRQRRLEEQPVNASLSAIGGKTNEKRKLNRLVSSISNPSENSDNDEKEVLSNASHRINLDMNAANDDTDDLLNIESDTDLVNQSSYTSGEDTRDSDLSEEEPLNTYEQKKLSKPKHLAASLNKKSFIPLRDRIRNLRHRQSLNLTEQTDYKNVLDSLNVVCHETESMKTKPSKFFDKVNFSQNNQTIEATESDINSNTPGTSASLNKKLSVKNLNELKRRIEMDNEDLSSDGMENKSAENQKVSGEKIYFKKLKRNVKKSHFSKNEKEESSE